MSWSATTDTCIVDGDRRNWCVISAWHWIWCDLFTRGLRQTFYASFCQSNR